MFKAFGLPETIPALEAYTDIELAFAESTDGTVPLNEIRRFLRKQVRETERKVNFQEFQIRMFEAAGVPEAPMFQAQLDVFIQQSDSYYSVQMKLLGLP